MRWVKAVMPKLVVKVESEGWNNRSWVRLLLDIDCLSLDTARRGSRRWHLMERILDHLLFKLSFIGQGTVEFVTMIDEKTASLLRNILNSNRRISKKMLEISKGKELKEMYEVLMPYFISEAITFGG